MKIRVIVRTGAREECLEEIAPGQYRVSIRERPVGGRANRRVIGILAEHFRIPTSSISIRFGIRSKRKTIELVCPSRGG